MHTLIFFILLMLTIPRLTADKISDVIARGMVTKEFTETLTHDDVPAKWRTSIADTNTDRYVKKAFSRGTQKVLEVMWIKDWLGPREKMFVATVYDGTNRVAKMTRLGDHTVITEAKHATGYELITSVKDDGSVSVMVQNDKGYFEVVEVRGRETHLLDELEYTKALLLTEQFTGPLLNAIQDQLDRESRKPSQSPRGAQSR